MSGEYGGWNGIRDFSGEGKGCGLPGTDLRPPYTTQTESESQDL
jgi:hypothetical protein